MNHKIDRKPNGTYTIKHNEELLVFPSVTTILATINKPMLVEWAAGQVYDAMMLNSNMNRKEAVASIYTQRDKKAKIGSRMHSWFEAVGNGGKVTIDDLPEDEKGYGIAFNSFLDTFKPEFIKTEHTVFSLKGKFAGTCDAIVKDKSNKTWLLDFKTSNGANYPEHGLQLCAYAEAVQEMEPNLTIDKQAIVHLKPDGTFTLYENHAPIEVFLACLNLYEYLNRKEAKV